ncbi:LOW QUALITY PROTEIN: hypothetical protein T265_13815 [Opisthorchis viverrini]|uniref:Uncharacterized protein n=1 Tax=Opisthorchis viverrini TaxID=6198 RepID=A0A074ZNN7_OPIVI|nr:LOW QUALITY PROTEIN: hypothetical protein T265_13815 [Opisthorchis viverrini]KER27402.1 LOW QUALITY PROTEIN: hypothetical protein T265_13815 [Opisthorchis viverrini]
MDLANILTLGFPNILAFLLTIHPQNNLHQSYLCICVDISAAEHCERGSCSESAYGLHSKRSCVEKPLDSSPWYKPNGFGQLGQYSLHLPNEPAFVHWFSRVHLGRRFADLIIVDGLEGLFSPDRMRASDVLRLTSLLEDTRNFIDTSTNPEDHGHGCRLLVTCCLPVQSSDSTHSPTIPVHSLEETFIFSEDSTNCYSILGQKDRWKLNLEYVEGELFWKTFHPPPNVAAIKT